MERITEMLSQQIYLVTERYIYRKFMEMLFGKIVISV